MSAIRSLSLAARCSDCRFKALSAFAAFAGLQIRPQICVATPTPKSLAARSRHYHVSSLRLADSPLHERTLQDGSAVESVAEHRDALDVDQVPAQDSSVPWYLREQAIEESQSSLSERQKLPDIPSDAPEHMKAVLDHLSVEIGLDHLTLIDLRELDPPPALGSGLIMLVGTARSEKHLHVSADRFCRWLRTEYKLSPFADGLLGRNELKLKLRRKARRAKLLGGAKMARSPEEEEDDGIKTGWVCVNVGLIEESQAQEPESSLESTGGTGFGSSYNGTRLVVQILTEEKRGSLDLESLWTGYIRRQQKKEARQTAESELEALQENTKRAEVGHVTSHHFKEVTDSESLVGSRLQRPNLSPLTQTRGFHSGAKDLDKAGDASFSKRTQRSLQYKMALEANTSKGETDLKQARIAAKKSLPKSMPTSRLKSSKFTTPQNPQGANELQMLMGQLKEMPEPEKLAALGDGYQDRSSTQFLQNFYDQIPLFAQTEHYEARLELIRLAIHLRHPGYDANSMIELLHEMEESAIEIPPTSFESIIQAIFMESTRTSEQSQAGPTESLLKMMPLLEAMSLRAQPTFSPSVLEKVTLLVSRALSTPLKTEGGPPSIPPTPSPALLSAASRLSRLRQSCTTPLPADNSLDGLLLTAFARGNRWDDDGAASGGFWRHWRIFPLRMVPRPAELYVCMFAAVAQSGHQTRAIRALSDWVAEMERERPPVRLEGDVARAVAACVRVAAPEAEGQIREGRNPRGEYVRLWRRCVQGLDGGREEEVKEGEGMEEEEERKGEEGKVV